MSQFMVMDACSASFERRKSRVKDKTAYALHTHKDFLFKCHHIGNQLYDG
jgi:hypothetical protein